MVKRVVNGVDVVDVEKRRLPSKHYVYVVNVSWSDGSKTVIYRRYSRFFELQVRVLELFPEEGGEDDPGQRMIPFLPGKIIFGRSHIRNVAMKRLNNIDDYCKALVRLPSHISECYDVLQFFQVEDEDLNPVRDEKDLLKSQVFGEVISEPMLLEQYVAIADYKKKQKNEVTLQAGVAVEVVEKNENGWWFVNVEEEQGWVPASYLEPAEGGGAAKEAQSIAKRGEEETFVTIQEYTSQARDEISFEKGVVVEVIQKNLEGWWRVRYQGKEGVVPAAYLQYMSAKPADVKSEGVTVVATAAAAVTETLQREQEEDASKPGKRHSTSRQQPAQSSQSRVAPPRRQSIKVTKKMRSQSRGGSDARAALRTAVAAAAVSESISEAASSSSSPPPSSSAVANSRKSAAAIAVARTPSSDKHAIVTCAYQAVGDSELSVRDGDEVEVVERNESGWWFVDRAGHQGWVPSSSFEAPSSAATSPPDTPGRPSSPAATAYVTMAVFQSAADDGISFTAGRPVTVQEKAASGWWYVVIDGKEGWAPSSYIEEAKASPGTAAKAAPSKHQSTTAAGPVDISNVALRSTKSGSNGIACAKPHASPAAGPVDISKVALRPTKAKGADPTPAKTSTDGGGSGGDFKSELGKVALKSTRNSGGGGLKPTVPRSSGPSSPAVSTRKSHENGSGAAAATIAIALKPARPATTGDDKTSTSPAAKATSSPAEKVALKPGAKSREKSPAKPATPAAAAKRDEKPPAKPAAPATAAKKEEKAKPARPANAVTKSGGYKALSDYAAEDSDSLSFREGDKLELVEKNDSGWWLMRMGGDEGWAPSTYFEEDTSSSKSGAAVSAGGVGAMAAQISKMHEARLSKAADHSTTPAASSAGPPKPKATGPPIPKLPDASKASGSGSRPSTSGKSNGSGSGKGEVSSSSAPPRPAAMKPPMAAQRTSTVGKPEKPKAQPKTTTGGGSSNGSSSADGEAYIVTANYSADGADEISLREGDEVTLVDKAASGWWCVRVRGKEGWAPSTYLEKKKTTPKGAVSKPGRPKLPKQAAKKAGNRASAAYHGEAGEVSFEEGEALDVLERADTGWWFVRTGSGVEGWAPSTFIQ